VACPVLLVVAITGAIYTFREELENWQQADLRFVEPVGEAKPLSEQLAAVSSAHTDWKPTRVTLAADARKSTVVQVERPDAEKGSLPAVFVNPYTAEVIAEGDVRSPFFSGVLTVHRNLFAGTFGRIVVEVTTSWTLVLLVSGVFLWLPKRWSQVWGVWLPRLRGKAYVALRDLHSIGGLLLTPIITLIAITGLVFSVVWFWSFNLLTYGAIDYPRDQLAMPPVPSQVAPVSPSAVDVAVHEAREQFPNHTLTLQFPKKPTEAYVVTARHAVSASVAGTLGVDPATGRIIDVKRAEDLAAVQQARLYVLPIHIGTIGGTPTKIVAFLACLALVGLAVSGVWMWLIRRPAGRWGFPRLTEAPVPRPAVVAILLMAIALPTVGLSLVLVLAGEWLIRRAWRLAPDPSSTETKVEVPVLSVPHEVLK
jgi:uncharacterized iron-regulated membrane protein